MRWAFLLGLVSTPVFAQTEPVSPRTYESGYCDGMKEAMAQVQKGLGGFEAFVNQSKLGDMDKGWLLSGLATMLGAHVSLNVTVEGKALDCQN